MSTTSRSAAAEKKVKSLCELGGLTLPQLGQRVWDEINANNAFGRAAELAFYFLFALFLLLLIMMTLFGLTASDNLELRNRLLSYFADFLPPPAFQLLNAVVSELTEHASGGKLTFGIVSALWCVSGGIGAMISWPQLPNISSVLWSATRDMRLPMQGSPIATEPCPL